MQLIYENIFKKESLFEYKYILIWMNYVILIKKELIKIVPTDYKYFNFSEKSLAWNTSVLQNFSVILPLNKDMISRFDLYKYLVLQNNTVTSMNEFWFVNKVWTEYQIKEKIVWGKKLADLNWELNEEVFTFIKRLL